MEHKKVVLSQIPILLFGMIFLIDFVVTAFKVWISLGISVIGILMIFIGCFLLVAFFLKYRFFQILWGVTLVGFAIFLGIIFVATSAKMFRLMFFLGVYSGLIGFWLLIDSHKSKKETSQKSQSNYSVRNITSDPQLKSLGLLIMIFSFSGFGLLAFLYFPPETQSITITQEQAESYDLVVYFPDFMSIDDEIAEIFAEANATLSFPLYESAFDPGSSVGGNASLKVKLLNNYGIPVEIWPLFNWDEGSYPSISEIDRWFNLYEKFQNWTVDNGLEIQYLMWDIESGGEGSNLPDFSDWPVGIRDIAGLANYPLRIADVDQVWMDALDEIQAISDQCTLDGHQMTTTTHTIIWDVFDGDGDLQKHEGLPVWDVANAYDYISMMAYRGCEWGGNTSRAMIYENVRASALSQPDPIAICLGCINYTPYPTISSVVEDVYLALGAGATCVRLFQANSWINGVGTWQNSNGNWIYGGPAHGVDNETTEGLRQLMLACRQAGQTEFVPNRDIRLNIFTLLLEDKFMNYIRI